MRPSLTVFAAALVATCLVGCGRPATEADCTLIVEQNIRVALDPNLDEKTKDEKLASYKKQLDGDVKACVGKRVTDSYLACVRAAKTAAAITDCGK